VPGRSQSCGRWCLVQHAASRSSSEATRIPVPIHCRQGRRIGAAPVAPSLASFELKVIIDILSKIEFTPNGEERRRSPGQEAARSREERHEARWSFHRRRIVAGR
jgi:hypothetical protein